MTKFKIEWTKSDKGWTQSFHTINNHSRYFRTSIEMKEEYMKNWRKATETQMFTQAVGAIN